MKSNTDESSDQESWKRWVPLGFLILVVVAFLVCRAWPSDSEDRLIGTGVGPTEPTPTPMLLHDYQTGEIRTSGWTQSLYEAPPPDYTGDSAFWPSFFHIHDGDVVEILGQAELVEGYWYWPIRVLQGGIYPEGGDYWIYDDEARLFGPTVLGERPVPPFAVGEEVDVSYNFCLRTSPAGPTIGKPCHMIYGGADVVITTEPIFGASHEFLNGRYWCEIEMDYYYIKSGWVSCEFAKK